MLEECLYTITYFLKLILAYLVQIWDYMTRREERIEFDNVHDKGLGSTLTVGVVCKIAEGGFSYVYEVRMVKKTDQRYAMKRILCSDEETIRKCRDEIGVHRSFHHPTLLPLIAHKFEKSNGSMTVCYMLFPLISSSLRDQLNDRLQLLDENSLGAIRPWTEREILEIFGGVVDAIAALHENGYAHRDIKLENILYDVNTQRPVLMDFGSVAPAMVPIRSRTSLLKLIDEASENSTVSYRAPELFEGHVHYGSDESDIDGRVDIWSLGCVLFGMMYGYSPFECEIRGEKIKVVECSYLRVLGAIPTPSLHSELYKRYDQELFQFVVWLLNQDRLERPSIQQVSSRVDELLEKNNGTRRWRNTNRTSYSDSMIGGFYDGDNGDIESGALLGRSSPHYELVG